MSKQKVLAPMAAPNDVPDLDKIRYPVLVSTKLDGFRCLIYDGQMYTRKLEEFHPVAQAYFKPLVDKLNELGVFVDGEIIGDGMKFNEIAHALTDVEEVKKLKLHVFDGMPVTQWYVVDEMAAPTQAWVRYRYYKDLCDQLQDKFPIVAVEQVQHDNAESIREAYKKAIESGEEGLMLRYIDGKYRLNRCTAKEDLLWKMKEFNTVTAKIIGFKQKKKLKAEVKAQESKKNGLGRSKRGSRKNDRELADEVGSVEVEIIKDQIFPEGTTCFCGFAKEAFDLRKAITWENKDEYLGKFVDIVSADCGVVEKPRFPRIVRVRSDLNDKNT